MRKIIFAGGGAKGRRGAVSAVERIVSLYKEFLPKLVYPVRKQLLLSFYFSLHLLSLARKVKWYAICIHEKYGELADFSILY